MPHTRLIAANESKKSSAYRGNVITAGLVLTLLVLSALVTYQYFSGTSRKERSVGKCAPLIASRSANWSTNTSDEEHFNERHIAASGRLVELGQLYHRPSNQFLYGLSFWRRSSIRKREEVAESFSSSFIEDDSLESKLRAFELGIDVTLSVNLLIAQASFTGTFRYLNDYKSTSEEKRLTSVECFNSGWERLDRSLLRSPPEFALPDDIEATHLVVGIKRGIRTVFLFEESNATTSDTSEWSGGLRFSQNVLTFRVSASLDVHALDEAHTRARSVSSHFFGDLLLPANPTGFLGAIKTMQEMPSIVRNQTKPNGANLFGVAQEVVLMPLEQFRGRAFRELPILVAQRAMHFAQQLIANSQALEELYAFKAICQRFGWEARQELDEMKELLDDFRHVVQADLKRLALDVANGTRVAEDVTHKLDDLEASPFASRYFMIWVEEKRHEFATLDALLLNTDLVVTESDALRGYMFSGVEHIIALSFPDLIALRKRPTLDDMRAYISQNLWNSTRAMETWCMADDEVFLNRIQMALRPFREMIESSQSRADVLLLVVLKETLDEYIAVPPGGFAHYSKTHSWQSYEPPEPPPVFDFVIKNTYHGFLRQDKKKDLRFDIDRRFWPGLTFQCRDPRVKSGGWSNVPVRGSGGYLGTDLEVCAPHRCRAYFVRPETNTAFSPEMITVVPGYC